ncbi:MAG: indolepyruvate ferredoxin oxidoreductase subunit alpha [Candidatus Thermoplasmatota archaeon]|nr:indolepyruvate ferredoxin oxidoreductase subunit alpha [Candidatus Thermoplasmatota archaeon]
MGFLDKILAGEQGENMLMLGNEAVARGVIEAGVGVAATYPGTPSSEVGDVLSRVAEKAGIYFELSVNEKVAVEVAYAAAITGVRSFAFMKHVGVNVASDVIMSAAYTGVRAGMVIMTADDPSMFSSQNEQDNRHYADLAHLPMVEPSNPQEALQFLVSAFGISETLGIPVIFRTTTRVSHQRARVSLGAKIPITHADRGHPGVGSYTTLPSVARKLRAVLSEKMEKAMEISESTDLTRIEKHGDCRVGFITAGEGYNCLYDVLMDHSIGSEVLKLGMTSPLPTAKIASFLARHEEVFVVEELDPYLEGKVRGIAQLKSIPARIYGKMDGIFPKEFEYSPDIVEASLSKVLSMKLDKTGEPPNLETLPPRPPVLCPGCPHRSTYYAVKRAVRMSGLKEVVYSSDIGCYTLGAYEPFNTADVVLEMGSSIGIGAGLGKVTDRKVISFIGDSTFFHSGIPPLINAVRNGSRMTVVIMDNSTTAMTGQQTNPGLNLDGMGIPSDPVSIESIVRSAGVKDIFVADPYDLKNFLGVMLQSLKIDRVSVVIARRECAILRDREMRKNGKLAVYAVEQEKCGLCMNCVENFSCPAISIVEGRITIDPELCDGCGVCAEPMVCPFRAIRVAE